MPEILQAIPQFDFRGISGTYYSILMFDTDAPEVDNPKFRDFVHYAVVNIPANDCNAGDEVVPYLGPLPYFNSGIDTFVTCSISIVLYCIALYSVF